MKPRSTAAAAAVEGALGAALQRDIAATSRLLGAQSVRAAVVELQTMTIGSSWTFADLHDGAERPPEGTPDSAFSTAPSTFTRLAEAATDETMVRRLSPRRWAFAWRLDGERAVVGEAQLRDKRDSLDAGASALLRLLCDSGIRAGGTTAAAAATSGLELAWPQIDRRARPRPSRTDAALLACAVAATLIAGWLCLYALPRSQAAHEALLERADQDSRRADNLTIDRLANALATGDYGEVQTELSMFAGMGYFSTAVVTNAKQRVVATVGPASGRQVGMPLGDEAQRGLRRVVLALGTQQHGALWLPVEAPAPRATGAAFATPAAALGCLASLAAAALVGQRFRRRR